MGLFGIKFGKQEKQDDTSILEGEICDEYISTKKQEEATKVKRGMVNAERMCLDFDAYHKMKKRFIAIDFETTGLDPEKDRIIEVGAALFENGVMINLFGTLVNANRHVKKSASEVNHITDDMLKKAPSEETVYEAFVSFLGDGLNGETLICAYNAKFDMGFLTKVLIRMGYDAEIRYVDACSLSSKYFLDLRDYKQGTVARYLGLNNKNAHEAKADAEICGQIMCKLLLWFQISHDEARKDCIDKLSMEEVEVCAYLQNVIDSRGGDTKLLGFYKNSYGYIDLVYVSTFLKFRFLKKGKYLVVSKEAKGVDCFKTGKGMVLDGGEDYVRVYFDSPFELDPLEDYIFSEYQKATIAANEYLKFNKSYIDEYLKGPAMRTTLSKVAVKNILLTIKETD